MCIYLYDICVLCKSPVPLDFPYDNDFVKSAHCGEDIAPAKQ